MSDPLRSPNDVISCRLGSCLGLVCCSAAEILSRPELFVHSCVCYRVEVSFSQNPETTFSDLLGPGGMHVEYHAVSAPRCRGAGDQRCVEMIMLEHEEVALLAYYIFTRSRPCLPTCVALCNCRSARTLCAPQPLPSHPAGTMSSAAALPLLASSAAAARLSKPKTPRCSETSWRTGD